MSKEPDTKPPSTKSSKPLDDILQILESEIRVPDAACAIYSDTAEHESTLGGTRDGLLNVAKDLIAIAAKLDDSKLGERVCEADIKQHLLMFPGNFPYLVSLEGFRDHASMIRTFKNCFEGEPGVLQAIENDPDFRDPSPSS